MKKNSGVAFSLRGTGLLLLVTACSLAFSQQPVSEQAVTRTFSDSDLQWGPCPAFLPDGCGIAVLHGNPAEANVDVFLKVPGNSELALHSHTSAERIILVAGELHVTYEGQAMTILKPGTYAYGPATKPHSGECVSPEPCVLFIAFEEPLDAIPVAQ